MAKGTLTINSQEVHNAIAQYMWTRYQIKAESITIQTDLNNTQVQSATMKFNL